MVAWTIQVVRDRAAVAANQPLPSHPRRREVIITRLGSYTRVLLVMPPRTAELELKLDLQRARLKK